jgi:hypothetical protein
VSTRVDTGSGLWDGCLVMSVAHTVLVPPGGLVGARHACGRHDSSAGPPGGIGQQLKRAGECGASVDHAGGQCQLSEVLHEEGNR